MWPYDTINPMAPYFQAAKAAAANVPSQGERGDYTAGMFQEDFPQFYQKYKVVGDGDEHYKGLISGAMLETFIAQANDSILPSRWGSLWRYAAGLYVAHFGAMYLKTYQDGSASGAAVAGKAAQVGAVKSAQMGNTSISYDNAAVTAGTEKWGAWNATQYGQQLVTLARQVGMGGMYVI